MPFLLNPNMKEGEPIQQHIAKKYGASTAEEFMKPNSRLATMGQAVGIHFNNDRYMVNTVNAHILMEYLNEQDVSKANELMELLYESYFVQAQNINDSKVLVELAAKVGIDNEAKVKELLNDDERKQAILYADHQAKAQLRVSGVPFFMIGNGPRPVAFSGAQPIEIIQEVLEEQAEE